MTTTTSTISIEKVQAFAGLVAANHGIATNAILGYLGDRLGIWRTLAGSGPVTSAELADRTGLAERYLREWLSAQAAAGYVTYDATDYRFELPAEHAMVLADDDSPAALAGAFEIAAGSWAVADRLAHAYATGEGIGWHEHDPRIFSGVERFYRPMYAGSLVSEWLPAVDGLVERLEQGIRVLDVGCGFGTPTVMMAQAFPNSVFVGVDYHAESLDHARAAAERAGVSGRVSFVQADAEEASGGPYDLICMFDALHDLGDPVGALQHARHQLNEGGVVFAVEPGAGDHLTDNLHPLGLAWYVGSANMCVPNSLSQPGHAALGTQAGPARTLAVFREAGFTVARQAAATTFNLVYEARG